MPFYCGHYDRPPDHAKAVAKAFYEGRSLKRSNCETDGERYWVKDNCIAQRIDIPKRVARKLKGVREQMDNWDFPTVRISWAGWDTWMTARHLMALGFDAAPTRKSRRLPRMVNGKSFERVVGFVTAEEIEAMPIWEPKKPEPKPYVNPRQMDLPFLRSPAHQLALC